LSNLTHKSNQLLKTACSKEASDIHFFPFQNKVTIYFRIHGKRVFYRSLDRLSYQQLLAYYKFTSGMDIGEVRKPQNGTFTFTNKNETYSLRLSTLPIHDIESLAIRILPQKDDLSLQHLFLFPYQLHQLKNILAKQNGLILLTGPTGSGKTTTLYALLETLLKQQPYQAVTLEDPIEKRLDNILQVQINEKSGMTYDTGLKAALRHDPDIIMVGEIREANVAHFAYRAALTGHLVFSTLHAKDSLWTIHRLLEMGLSKIDIKQSLIAVIALQLLPIIVNGQTKRRAAIFEMLNEKHINDFLDGKKLNDKQFQSFSHLRKKAYAYGFIDQKTFNDIHTSKTF